MYLEQPKHQESTMTTIEKKPTLAEAEDHIRRSLESRVSELYPTKDEELKTKIVNATHDAFCLKGSARNQGFANLERLGIVTHTEQRELEIASEAIMKELVSYGVRGLDMNAVQSFRWYD
ncbi:hypothetical protein D3C84_321050 [compost metagenome]